MGGRRGEGKKNRCSRGLALLSIPLVDVPVFLKYRRKEGEGREKFIRREGKKKKKGEKVK